MEAGELLHRPDVLNLGLFGEFAHGHVIDHALTQRAVPSTIGILLSRQVDFKYRLQHQHQCRHADSVADTRNTQRSLSAVGLGDIDLFDRLGSITLLSERLRQFT